MLQRLFFYLSVVTFFQEAALVMQVERLFSYHGQEAFCTFIGFFITWTGSMVYLFTFVITAFLLIVIYNQLHGSRLLGLVERTRSCRIALECGVVALVLLCPLAYLWVPLMHGNFALSGAWCWMRTIDQSTCKSVGFVDQLVFVYTLVSGVNLFSVASMFLLAIVFCRLASKYRHIRHQHLQKVKETLVLMAFLIASILFDASEIAVRLYTGISHKQEFYGLWMAYAIGPPISKLVFPLGFLVYLYSLKKLSRASIRRAASDWKRCCSPVFTCCGRCRDSLGNQDPPGLNEQATTQKATFHSSVASTLPSKSFFSPPYTNGFTNVSEAIVTGTENEPLVSAAHCQRDTGYSSVTVPE